MVLAPHLRERDGTSAVAQALPLVSTNIRNMLGGSRPDYLRIRRAVFLRNRRIVSYAVYASYAQLQNHFVSIPLVSAANRS